MADTLSRQEMEAVIAKGGSVLHQGRTISTLEGLPTAVQLAHSDEDRAKAKAALEQQRAGIDAQIKQLDEAGAKEAPKAAAAKEPDEPKAHKGK